MGATEKELIEKAREIAEGDIKVWQACMDMARWVLENKPVIQEPKDVTDWQVMAAKLRDEVLILRTQNQQMKTMLEKALQLIQDPKARWDSWISDVLSVLPKKKS